MQRHSHAALDIPSRACKAAKIERHLGLAPTGAHLKLLEIGTSSGGIAHCFARHPTLDLRFTAVDVVDQRLVRDDYDFELVRGTQLPFPERHFDIVISNHVFEHVGDQEAQRHHLQEVHRVLRPSGVAYLAVPNRSMLVEPHHRLAFLRWMPRRWRSTYLRWMRRGSFYDCEPPTKPKLETMLAAFGFRYRFLSSKAIAAMRVAKDRDDWLFRLATAVPESLLNLLGYWNPTSIYRLEK